MKTPSLALKTKTPNEWIHLAIDQFDSFLVNHAACERKASTTGLQFVVRYPNRAELVESMIQLSREELMHFHQVWRIIQKRGGQLAADEKDPYVNRLLQKEIHGSDYGLMDRLIIFGIVEARGCEKFRLVGDHHPDPEIKSFYSSLADAEVRHHELFLQFAVKYFGYESVEKRMEELLSAEAEIISSLPLKPTVH